MPPDATFQFNQMFTDHFRDLSRPKPSWREFVRRSFVPIEHCLSFLPQLSAIVFPLFSLGFVSLLYFLVHLFCCWKSYRLFVSSFFPLLLLQYLLQLFHLSAVCHFDGGLKWSGHTSSKQNLIRTSSSRTTNSIPHHTCHHGQ